MYIQAINALPVNGIDFLLGNDLAGDKVIVNPLVTETPCIYQPWDPVEIEVPNLDPPSVVTRSSKKTREYYGYISVGEH